MLKNVTCLSDLTGVDIIDSRDLVELIEELEDEQEEAIATETLEDWECNGGAEMLDALRELRRNTEPNAGNNWDDGIAFISEDYFETHAQEYADDIGAIDLKASWPLAHLDWEAAADELKVDYTSCTINGQTYWYR